MSSILYRTIEQISREKSIDLDVIISAVEDAILTAAKKYYRTDEDLQARLNRKTGQVEVFGIRKVVEEVIDPEVEISLREAKRNQPSAEIGADIEIHKPTDVLGRIAAQVLLGTTASLTALRETVHFYEGIPVLATYHPAALLRNPHWKRPAWDDVRKLRALYDALGQ